MPIFKEFRIEPNGSWTKFKFDEPTFEDFTTDNNIRRTYLTIGRVVVPKNVYENVVNNLEDSGIAIVVGDADCGKTWLCYTLGFRFKRENKEVWFATIDQSFDPERALNEIFEIFERREFGFVHFPPRERLIIFEDCQKEPQKVNQLVDKITKATNTKFLFSLRKVGECLLENYEDEDSLYVLGTQKNCIVNLPRGREARSHVVNIIKEFTRIEGIKASKKEMEQVADKWGDNLHWLKLTLHAWKRALENNPNRKLSELTDYDIFEFIWESKEINLRDSSRRRFLCDVATFCQFEYLWPERDFLKPSDEMTESLREDGILKSLDYKGHEFLIIRENLARAILRTMEWQSKQAEEYYDEKFNLEAHTKQKFREYLVSRPPNWIYLFKALHQSRNLSYFPLTAEFLPKDILTFLLSQKDSIKAVKKLSVRAPFWEKYSLLRALKWVKAYGIACDIWFSCIHDKDEVEKLIDTLSQLSPITQIGFYYILHQICMKRNRSLYYFTCSVLLKNKNLRSNLINNLPHLNANNLMRALYPLLAGAKANLLDSEQVLKSLSLSDWINIIDKSTLPSVRRLFYTFSRWGLETARSDLARAVIRCNLAPLVNKETSLHRLTGLIFNVIDVDALERGIIRESIIKAPKQDIIPKLMKLNDSEIEELKVVQLIRKLSNLNLGDLFLKEDRLARKEGKTKIETVNYFLSRIIAPICPPCFKTVMDKIEQEVWLQVFYSAISLEEAFWLLWNIYRANQARAKALVHQQIARLLLAKFNHNQSLVSTLASYGLLHICEFEPVSPLHIDFNEIIEILRHQTSPTLIVLSLIGSRIVLPKNDFGRIKRFANEKYLWTTKTHEIATLNDFVAAVREKELRNLLQDLIETFLV